ncbi:MAG: hypothetical protein M5U14_16465 [Acidimicrobiia bacterium]|nr:hypothetical protein [Acidimicrobiia bacterium]
MSDDPTFGRLPADELDEGISALLDDELEAWAAERGVTTAEARTLLESQPAFPDRSAALDRARAALGAPVPPLDELTRRRLLAAATPSASPRPDVFRRWLAAGAAAALVALVGAGAILALRDGDDGERADTGSEASRTAAADAAYVGSLGELADDEALRAALEERLGRASGAAPAPEAADGEGAGGDGDLGGAPASEPQDLEATSSTAPTAPEATVPPGAAARCAGEVVGDADEVLLLADAVYEGIPAVVVAIRDAGRVVAFVTDAGTCEVLVAVSF